MALESKMLIVSPALSDAATIVDASTAAPSMPETNLLTQQPTDRFRSYNSTATFAVLDFGELVTVDFIALLFHNATSAATIRHRFSDTGTTELVSSPDYDSGGGGISMWYSNAAMTTGAFDFSTWPRKHHFHYADIGQTVRYYRFDIADTTNPDLHIDAGRLVVGLKYQPGVNIAYGSSLPFPIEPEKSITTLAGPRFPITTGITNRVSAELQFTDKDELQESLHELLLNRGSAGDVFYVNDPTSKWAHHESCYGTINATSNPSIPEYGFWSYSLSIEGLI